MNPTIELRIFNLGNPASTQKPGGQQTERRKRGKRGEMTAHLLLEMAES